MFFGLLADRFTQKSLLDELNLSTSPWCLLKDKTQWNDISKLLARKSSSNVEQADMMDVVNGLSAMKTKQTSPMTYLVK